MRIPLILFAAAMAAGAESKVGYLRVENGAGIAHLWYPTEDPREPAERRYLPMPVSRKIAVIEGAEVSPGAHPVVLFSHGILGLATSYSWLAHRLAAAGAVVLSPEHKDQSRADFAEPELFRFDKRPRTLSAQLDWLLAEPRFAGRLDTARVAVIGHSVGGQTALWLAGARYDLPAILAAGKAGVPRNRLAGRMARQAEAVPPTADELAAYAADYRDPRVKRVVLLDPVPVYPGFTDSSLRALSVPVLYVGCSRSEIFDSDSVKYALGRLIPGLRIRETGAGHFVFAEEGTWLGRMIRPGIFKDPGGGDRARIHSDIYGWLAEFLDPSRDPPLAGR